MLFQNPLRRVLDHGRELEKNRRGHNTHHQSQDISGQSSYPSYVTLHLLSEATRSHQPRFCNRQFSTLFDHC